MRDDDGWFLGLSETVKANNFFTVVIITLGGKIEGIFLGGKLIL